MSANAKKPDFKEINRMIVMLRETDRSFQEMFDKVRILEEEVKKECGKYLLSRAEDSLGDIPVEELKSSETPIRTALLLDAGYRTLRDLRLATDRELLAVSGIGEKQLASIRRLTEGFLRGLAEHGRFSLTTDGTDRAGISLILKTCRFLKARQVTREASEFRGDLHEQLEETIPGIRIRNGFRWFFSTRDRKEETLSAVGALIWLCSSPLTERAVRFTGLYREAEQIREPEALQDFKRNSAPYYALFENLTGAGEAAPYLYESIPMQLASEISKEELDLTGFRGDIRAYQAFGARYILHQKRVLLGDEMGLGKTIQAIAAMTHIAGKEPGARFLIVCPASVMINWCREISRFSGIEVFLVHGSFWDVSFDRWKARGGAAVTNYESMGKLVGLIDQIMTLSLFVIDEAHYIKNPQAKRTQYIHRLDEESQRILLMTGTPLENRVDEMCELIRFIRPDLEKEIREKARFRFVPEFRELLSPVYLRRLREQVLKELPPVTEQEEWCRMTPEDRNAYLQQLQEKNFMGMRRVSFLQDDLTSSAKALRLRELCGQACREGRKAVVFSYFRETVRKAEEVLVEMKWKAAPAAGGAAGSGVSAGESLAGGMSAGEGPAGAISAAGPAEEVIYAGTITGSTPPGERQEIIDRFTELSGGAVLLCQIQAGGTGVNLQAASVVIFCEPQIKPSLTRQAISRVHRMGQTENVLVCHLLCEDTIDEAMTELLRAKQEEFDTYAEESTLADAAGNLADPEWIRQVIEEQRQKYLPVIRA